MATYKPDVLRPAIIGGLIGTVLTLTPGVCCLNACCCLNFIIAGAIAGGIYAGRCSRLNWYPGAGEGVMTGGLAGLICGTLHGLVVAAMVLVFGGLRRRAHGGLEVRYDYDLEWGRTDQLDQLLDRYSPWTVAWGQLGTAIVTGALAGALGGMIGVALFRRPVTPTYSPAPPEGA